MHWSKDHDILLVREVLAVDPYSEPKGSKERSKLWEEIAIHLNAVPDPQFSVTTRAVRDRVNLVLMKKYKKRMADEEKASGIAVDAPTEFDSAMEQICEKADAADKDHENLSKENKAKIEKEKKEAEEMRNKALERVGETRKRKEDADHGAYADSKQPAKRGRRSGLETVEYLRELSENERKIKQEELELRRQEKAAQEKREQDYQQQQLRQQEQQQAIFASLQEQQQKQLQQINQMQLAMMQQQQQQSQALLAVLQELAKQKK